MAAGGMCYDLVWRNRMHVRGAHPGRRFRTIQVRPKDLSVALPHDGLRGLVSLVRLRDQHCRLGKTCLRRLLGIAFAA
jgi:hypothetical protein